MPDPITTMCFGDDICNDVSDRAVREMEKAVDDESEEMM